VPETESQLIADKKEYNHGRQTKNATYTNRNAEGIRGFHIGDILSITTGRLVSPRHMDGIYES
jgi:hypothetical protein